MLIIVPNIFSYVYLYLKIGVSLSRKIRLQIMGRETFK